MPSSSPVTAVSAPGKVLLAGGYLVLDRDYTGLVFGLSARINVVASEIHTLEGVQLTEIVVESPQFLDAQWRYGYHLAPEGGGIQVTQLQSRGSAVGKNPFVEIALSYALTYVERVAAHRGQESITPANLIILADNDYYSQPKLPTDGDAAPATQTGRFARFPVPLSGANKTGLGSSAALVTALTAAVLCHYLPRDTFDVDTDGGKQILHNLAQAAHCAAQGKVGSGFDVAAAVYGSCRYRRFSPSLLQGIPEPGAPGFGEVLAAVVEGRRDGGHEWDVQVQKDWVSLPPGMTLRMCDVDCGSQTVGMVKKVLAWGAADEQGSRQLWKKLQRENDELASSLRGGRVGELPEKLRSARRLIKEMGVRSGVPIEPDAQTELLDAASEVEGVYGGVVPGAGGFDAVALLMRSDEGTLRRVEEFLRTWSGSSGEGAKVKLLDVRGEMEGVKREGLETYAGWI